MKPAREPHICLTSTIVVAGTLGLALVLGHALAAHAQYIYTEIANTGQGAFQGGQLFGTPVINPFTDEVLFSGQSAARTTGIHVGDPNGVQLLNADPPGLFS